MSQYGDRREEHENRKVPKERFGNGRYDANAEYDAASAGPMTPEEYYNRSRLASKDLRVWEDMYGGDE